MEARRIIPFVLIAAAAAVVFLWPTSHPDEAALEPDTTTTTVPFVPGVYGSSWQVVRGAPVAGRERMALAEFNGKIFVFGGVVAGFSGADLPPDQFLQDAWIYDPEFDTWELVPPPPFGMCALADPAAVAGGFWAPVVVWGRVDRQAQPGCIDAAEYDPASRTWRPLANGFFDLARLVDNRVFVHELPGGSEPFPPAARLVMPDLGRSLDLMSNTIMALDSPSSTIVPGGGDAASYTWTGEWYLGVDRGLLFGWNAGDEEWRWNLGGTPIASSGQAIAGTDIGFVLVNRTLQAAVLESPESSLWSTIQSVPLRASGCDPEVVSVAGKPVVHTCVGIAVYEPSAGGWIPFPPPVGIEGQLLATGDALYWFSGQVSRLEFPPGGMIAPRRLPIGLTDIELPDGYQFASSLGLVHTMDADLRLVAEVHGFQVVTPYGDTCSVLGLYQPTATGPEPGGTIIVDRPVLPPLEVLDYSQGGVTRFVVETSPTDTVEIRCGLESDARALVAALQWIKV